MVESAHKSFHLPESRANYPPPRDFKTENVKIELSLDFQRKSIKGSCTLQVTPTRQDVRSIRLDACDFDVNAVALNGTPAKFDYDGKAISVELDMDSKGPHQVKVEYEAMPREGIYFIAPDQDHPDKEVQAWTHGEAEFSRYWYPCHDYPNEKSPSELILTVPRGFKVISNGELLSTRDNGGSTTFHWREEKPHSSYLTSFVAGKFGEVVQNADGIPLQYYFPESKRADVLRYFGETPKMVEVFGQLTGVRYPYAKYSQTTVEDFIYGGMENFNATTLTTTYFPDAGSEEDFQASYSTPNRNAVNLVAHELAHQWFGDLVTCADWSHAWLNEAFATYFQALYIEKTRGVEELRWDLEAKAKDYFEEDESEYRRPIVDRVFVYPDDVFDYTTYEKGALMIHELRYVMGDEAFFKGISSYLKKFAYSNADSHDFLKTMEATSGLSLAEFFEQLFFKPGYPEFEAEYSWDDAGKVATLRVRQVQKRDDGTPIFKVPSEIVFYLGSARQKRKVWLDSAEQTLSFSLPEKPRIVELDPAGWVLKKIKFEKGSDLLLNQLSGSEDALSRADAAKSLGKLRAGTSVAALKAAAGGDGSWGVAASAFRALGEIGTDAALAAILELPMPKNRRTRRALAEALGNFKDEKAVTLLANFLESDESPYVRCEAALALAKSDPDKALPRLQEAMKARTPNETLAEACLHAMGKLKNEETSKIVKESLGRRMPLRVRLGAIKAIRERGAVRDDEVPVLKEILSQDPEFRMRLSVVQDVARHLGDRRFLDAVKRTSDSDKDHRVRRRALETFHELSSGEEASVGISKLKREVEELKEDNRRLKVAG